jgi:hypothetical protein
MHYTDSKRLDVKMRAIEDALSRIGEPITEAQAKSVAVLEDCECKDGMFALAATRRQLFAGTGLVAAVGMTAMLPREADAKAPPGAVEYPVPADPTKEQGRMMGVDGGYGSRRDFRLCRTATAPSRHPGYITNAITAASQILTRPSTISSSMDWSTGRSNTRSPISSASRLCRVRISWNAPALQVARS